MTVLAFQCSCGKKYHGKAGYWRLKEHQAIAEHPPIPFKSGNKHPGDTKQKGTGRKRWLY